MNTMPEVISEELINRAVKLNSNVFADVLGRSAAMDYKIKPVDDEMKVIGTAITVDVRPGDNLFLHEAIYLGKKGYVLIVDGKNDESNAYLGELMARASRAMGIEGIVVDGLVRDKDSLKELGFPIFAKGFTPNGPFKSGPGKINTPISCGGISVNPGDLVFGDSDGIVIIPKDKIENAIIRAEEKLKEESERIETIEQYEEQMKLGGSTTISIKPNWLKEKIYY